MATPPVLAGGFQFARTEASPPWAVTAVGLPGTDTVVNVDAAVVPPAVTEKVYVLPGTRGFFGITSVARKPLRMARPRLWAVYPGLEGLGEVSGLE